MSPSTTFTAPLPSQYDEFFVVKSIEDFNIALNFINSYQERSKRLKKNWKDHDRSQEERLERLHWA